MSTNEILLTDVSDRIGTITLNRPEARNALSSELLRQLRAAMAELDAHVDVDVLILTGSDPAFSAGLDLKELGGRRDEISGRLERVMNRHLVQSGHLLALRPVEDRNRLIPKRRGEGPHGVGRPIQEAPGFTVNSEQVRRLLRQLGIPAAGCDYVVVPLLRRQFADGVQEEVAGFVLIGWHGNTSLPVRHL